MYQNYVFDLYGTLVDIRTEEENDLVWEKLALFYGYYGALYAPGELKEAYGRLVKCKEAGFRERLVKCKEAGFRERLLQGKAEEGPHYSHEAFPEIPIEEVFRDLFTEKGIEPDHALVLHAGQMFRVLSTEYLRLYDGAADMLEKLRKKQKKIYLLSNAQRIFTEYELHMLDIAKYFDGIMISSDYGTKKPDLRFFCLFLEKYQLDPGKSIMIGNDLRTDIAGAAGAGMDTYYIHSNISPEYTGEISSLPEPNYMQTEMDIKQVCKALQID